jgi:hypothetical protein
VIAHPGEFHPQAVHASDRRSASNRNSVSCPRKPHRHCFTRLKTASAHAFICGSSAHEPASRFMWGWWWSAGRIPATKRRPRFRAATAVRRALRGLFSERLTRGPSAAFRCMFGFTGMCHDRPPITVEQPPCLRGTFTGRVRLSNACRVCGIISGCARTIRGCIRAPHVHSIPGRSLFVGHFGHRGFVTAAGAYGERIASRHETDRGAADTGRPWRMSLSAGKMTSTESWPIRPPAASYGELSTPAG